MKMPDDSGTSGQAGSPQEKDLERDQPLGAEDFYYEGPYLVFTEAYHLKRGYCCNSDCRHCPYR